MQEEEEENKFLKTGKINSIGSRRRQVPLYMQDTYYILAQKLFISLWEMLLTTVLILHCSTNTWARHTLR